MTEHIQALAGASHLELTLNRPEKKNAITVAMYAALADALSDAEEDPDVRAIVIAGEGSTFCAGNDLADFQQHPPTGDDSAVFRFLRAISSSSKVLIAAIQGAAVGVGATMLLHCDHVVAATDATLAFSFVKIGLVPEAASSLLLPRAVGHLAAAELMLTGDPLPAAQALSLGLVSRVVPAGEQLAGARAFASRLEGLPPGALRATKRLLRGDTTTVSDRMAAEGAVFGERLRSAEFAEAAAAFMEKRRPVFAR